MDDFKALRTFLLAAECHNFAAVARELGVTPASVTRTIAALEADLGVQLFVRTTRRVSLTSAGAAYAARLRPAMAAVAEARRELLDAHRADAGTLRINAPMSFGMRVLPGVLSAFRAQYPNIRADISLSDEMIDIVEGEFDLAVRISGPPSDKFTIWRKICPIDRFLVAAPDTSFAAATHPNDLPRDACLGFSPEGRAETWQLSHGTTRVDIPAGRPICANNGEFLAGVAAAGDGVALLPDFIVADALEQRRLVRILPAWAPSPIWLTLYYPPYQRLPPRVAAFSDFFEAMMQAKRGAASP
ncbi:LysR family transcriptional regulator [Salinisphaera sp. LB1]|uniref:LysR family transcriptional regulator n=1 Tax=Salinisphaera sp. LB1 TaxID=2183911 RepID=UPI000D7059D7|nr:LysR family transcriptional regulator [Salinisphaera sp. LB1]AWN15515.1 Transcriptional regulator, LysR family [Salinisphaera sp. LB1]